MRTTATAMQPRLFAGLPAGLLTGLVTGLLTGLVTAGCAWSGQQPNQGEIPARPMKPIDDMEPAVTQEVAAALARIAGDPQAETAPLLRTCPSAVPLELLMRTVKGEERNYLYRARCGASLLVAVTYGKSATIKQLTVKKE
jgi:hypothetical protein